MAYILTLNNPGISEDLNVEMLLEVKNVKKVKKEEKFGSGWPQFQPQ